MKLKIKHIQVLIVSYYHLRHLIYRMKNIIKFLCIELRYLDILNKRSKIKKKFVRRRKLRITVHPWPYVIMLHPLVLLYSGLTVICQFTFDSIPATEIRCNAPCDLHIRYIFKSSNSMPFIKVIGLENCITI